MTENMIEKMKVHILFTHGHHIEILLEYETTENKLFYSMNRWRDPRESWETDEEIVSAEPQGKNLKAGRFSSLINNKAEEIYSFIIQACPNEIIENWKQYHSSTKEDAFIFGYNCAMAAQWFLSKYAQIPTPKNLSAPFQLHQVYYYVHWPSFFPAFALIPHKVFHNAKFHLEARNRSEVKESYLQINRRMAISALVSFCSLTGIILASKYLSKSLNTLIIPTLGLATINQSLLLFKDLNLYAEKTIVEGKKYAGFAV